MHRITSAKVYLKQITSGELGARPGLGIRAEKDFTFTCNILTFYKTNGFRSYLYY